MMVQTSSLKRPAVLLKRQFEDSPRRLKYRLDEYHAVLPPRWRRGASFQFAQPP